MGGQWPATGRRALVAAALGDGSQRKFSWRMPTALSQSLKRLPRWLVVKAHLSMQEIQETRVRSLDGRSPGGGNGNPLRYSCLENPTDRGAWRTTVQSQTQLKRLILHTWERGALKKVINFSTKTHHRSPAKSFQSPYLSISPSPQKQAAESSLHR